MYFGSAALLGSSLVSRDIVIHGLAVSTSRQRGVNCLTKGFLVVLKIAFENGNGTFKTFTKPFIFVCALKDTSPEQGLADKVEDFGDNCYVSPYR